MRKRILLILLIFGVGVGVMGCRKASPPGVIVRAEITYEHRDETLYRCYTQPDKLSNLLMVLRLQEFRGYADEDPEKIAGDRCRIELTRMDGSKTIILQKDNRYRSRDYRRWERIDSHQGQWLYPFLRDLPGDVSGT